ncbi:MAG: ATP-binding protein [Peptococcaceae bacterium]|nr:ATP-binding protein [Peptococcaceae bacterium]
MFQKTRTRMVALNTIVFFIILNIFGFVIYMYTYSRLYSQVDNSLQSAMLHLPREQFNELSPQNIERQADRRVVYIIWDSKNNLILQSPHQAFLASDFDILKKHLALQKFLTVNIEGHKYRTLAESVIFTAANFKALSSPILSKAATVQAVISIDPETDMLNDLGVVIFIGVIIGGLISFFVGLFLAERALVPIKRSWEKQQQFVADASHELRTPLAVVQGQLEMLFRHPNQTIEQASSGISTMLSEVKRMTKMVSQLLTLARSDSDQLELEWRNFALDVLVIKVIEHFTQLAATKKIEIKTVIEKDVSFWGDSERIHQLLVILLDNALKYTSESGNIKVLCRQTKHDVELAVEDDGIGISQADLPHIFDRFYRGDKVRSRAAGGTGLGLSIARWIVLAHNGTISVDSKEGQGTRVHIVFRQKTQGKRRSSA